ncbi:MAG: class II aldolase/adducin family protein [Thermoanaerobaculaceae bacterium]
MKATSEWRLRAELVAIGVRLDRKGLVRGCEGNFSARLDKETFLISPRGRPKGSLNAWELVRSPLRGKLPPEASSEGLLHQRILAQHQHVSWVVHAHPPWVLALLSMTKAPDTTQLWETAGVSLRLLPDLAPGTVELARHAAEAAFRANTLLLPRHGLVAVGKSRQEAMALLETLEFLSFLTWARCR